MRNEKGFGLLGLLITIAIIMLIVWGGFRMSGGQKRNRIKQGRDDVQKARDAANIQNQYNQNLLDQIQK